MPEWTGHTGWGRDPYWQGKAPMAKEKDYIGFDPIKWIERLISVNASSSFTNQQKLVIDKALADLRRQLSK